jgi:hypothetical protein
MKVPLLVQNDELAVQVVVKENAFEVAKTTIFPVSHNKPFSVIVDTPLRSIYFHAQNSSVGFQKDV